MKRKKMEPGERMKDKTFEDALGEFTLRGKDHVETGDLIGVWIEIDSGKAFFYPRDKLIKKIIPTA